MLYIEKWFEKNNIKCHLMKDTISAFVDLDEKRNGKKKKNRSLSQQIADPAEKTDDTDPVDREALLDKYSKEIGVAKKIKQFVEIMPVLGFNSSGYDIPLIKKHLFDVLATETDVRLEDDIFFIKKTSRYVQVKIEDAHNGGLLFLDTMQCLAPGFSLDVFIKSFGDKNSLLQKSYFPYEYIDCYERLEERTMPPYEAFYSTLTQENKLNSELKEWKLKNNIPLLQSVADIRDRPLSGQEKHKQLCDMWSEKGWTCIRDYLRYYNTQDVIPFLIATLNYAKQLSKKRVDMFRDGMSLPGLAKQILLKHLPANMCFHISNPEIYAAIQKSEVGGQSIIFTRKNSENHPNIKGFDANALYLSCLSKPQFIGLPILYKYRFGELLYREGDTFDRKRGYSAEADLYLGYLENRILKKKNIILSREYHMRLSQKEVNTAKKKFTEYNIPKVFMLYNIFTDGHYIEYYNNNQSQERTVVQFDGCYWHACTHCFKKLNADISTLPSSSESFKSVLNQTHQIMGVLDARMRTKHKLLGSVPVASPPKHKLMLNIIS